MKKDNVMFVVLGLVVGLVVGFVGANSINKTAPGQSASANQMTANTSASGIPNLPADHPPLGTSSGSTTGGGGDVDQAKAAQMPEIAAAIDNAKQKPNDYEAQMTAADLYYQIQKFDEAAKLYEAAIKLKPGENEPLIKAGNAYFDKAETASENGDKAGSTPDFVKAEKFYTQSLAKNPNQINVRTDLGLTFFLREPRDIARAIKEYKTSLAIDPNHEITLQNLALAYTESGDKDALARTLEKLKQVNPNNPVLKKQ
ncbi:MAG: tetratricopeptide repeat protein [Chloracidobacterium sp.]|nr:tetratricopeptide repeat protein [Chloracidobacterium sp.]